MPAAGAWKYFWLAYGSKPVGERALYRLIARHKPRRIMEIGLGTATRSRRLIEVALRYAAGAEVYFVGVDQFETREAGQPRLTLKESHRLLKETKAQVQLVPGDPLSALGRMANRIRDIELLLVSAEVEPAAMDAAWFYIPRTLHGTARVLVEQPAADGKATVWNAVSRPELEQRARRPRRAA